MILLETVFAEINITFFTEVLCFCIFRFARTILFICTCNTTFTSWVITQWKMFSRQPDRWYQVESTPLRSKCLNQDLLCCQGRVRLTHGQALYVLMQKMVQANVKRQNYQTSVKNVILMSPKTVSSNIIPIVKEKGNRFSFF